MVEEPAKTAHINWGSSEALHRALSLVVDDHVQKQVFVDGELVISLELVDGVMVGQHASVRSDLMPARLKALEDYWSLSHGATAIRTAI